MGFPCGIKNPPANVGDIKRPGFHPWVEKNSWKRKWQPTPVFLPGKTHGQGSLVGYIVHGAAKSQTQLKGLSTRASIYPPVPLPRLTLDSWPVSLQGPGPTLAPHTDWLATSPHSRSPITSPPQLRLL